MENKQTIKLPESGYEVDIKTSLTWGDKELVTLEMTKGANINEKGLSSFDTTATLEAKYKLLELTILEIRKGKEKQKFTKDWVNNLPVADGDLLYDTVDALDKKK